jgi:thymidine kinase
MVAIDEGQFFPDLFLYVTQWADEQRIQILVAGLDGTFEREPFGDMLRLIPHAEEVVRLSAQCAYCLNGEGKAIYSRRKNMGGLEEQQGTVMVGGSDAYEPVCRFHYHVLAYKDRVE